MSGVTYIKHRGGVTLSHGDLVVVYLQQQQDKSEQSKESGNYLRFLLKLVSIQGLHLHEGGDGDSLIRGELGVLGGLEKI